MRALLFFAAFLLHIAARKPNHILFIVVDDLGFSDMSYKGSMYNLTGPLFPTPTLDKLALSGVRLESMYVHALCSPSRGAFLSGRYAYTTGGNAEVIVNGDGDQLPTNIRTIADLLKTKNWTTAAFGKWDIGMTTWGCTPLCRGFDRHGGFFNADESYFTHLVGNYLDLRLDFEPDRNSSTTQWYSSDLFAQRNIDWITEAIAGGAAHTFSYLAFQAIHGPQEAPAELVNTGFCADAIPADAPVRRIACGQMRSLDANIERVLSAYQGLGILQDTLIILSADNGGNTDTGGCNYPLRGAKATMFEGGMRAAAFASGAGLEAVSGTVSHAFYSLVDWLPTIAGSIAGVDIATQAVLPKHPFQPPPPPLDGVDIWESLSTGAPSPRTSALLYLDPLNCFEGDPPVPCTIPGQGALRSGDYKIIVGHVGEYMGTKGNVTTQFCGAHDGESPNQLLPPLNVTPTTSSPPFCPTGWVLPPGTPGGVPTVHAPPEEAAPGGACETLPCRLPSTSPLLAGGVKLFNVVSDMFETHDLAAEMPDVTAQLLKQFQAINATGIHQDHGAMDPASNPSNFGNVWTPWRGSRNPLDCDPNTTVTTVESNFDGVHFAADNATTSASLSGWCFSLQAPQGGRAPLNVTFFVDGMRAGSQIANVPRPPSFMNKTGAPNVEHGFDYTLPEPFATRLLKGKHTVRALVLAPDGTSTDARNSPVCVSDKNPVRCKPID